MSDPISVNGNGYSWGSLTAKTSDGDVLHGFFSINYAEARERAKGYGMGRHHAPMLRSSGKYTVENMKMGGWKHAITALKTKLKSLAKDGRSYGNVEFGMTLSYFEDDLEPITVEFLRCAWAKNSTSHEENPDPLKGEFEIDCMGIIENGMTLFDSSEGSPL